MSAALAGGACLLVMLVATVLCRAVGDTAAMAPVAVRPGEDAQWHDLADGMRRYRKHKAKAANRGGQR